ncbi:hypothetical protein [Methylobacterium dankookense]|uniref:Uncharacterized protein n=1 Tax=Methylobacterium dankookense TaxID=560405 RepID=A0A564G1F2_9HYPH|nr:hypothetical protein [Methylobacterium dankookense]GJD59574.1 hypothetical protein IFDJLNFL_5503 [Methylobacterium dankookense]VUF13982.1 hypothetical protein MTDSW087_03692 [Methylobacterium dankookense]
MTPLRAGAALAALLLSAAARAGEGDCFDAVDLDKPVALATVAGPERVPFVKSASAAAGCPGTAAACREKAYLVAGNAVLVGPARGDFVCATYVGAKGATRSGWLPRAALTEMPPAAAPGPDDWAGAWSGGPEHRIRISRKGAGLALAGDATYGALDPDRVKRGAVNMGSFAVDAKPEGAALAFTDGEKGVVPRYSPDDYTACSIRMRLLPPFLLVESNSACGGMNVSFTGLYRRG